MTIFRIQPRSASVLKVLLVAIAVLTAGVVLAGVAVVKGLRLPASLPDLHTELIDELGLRTTTEVKVNVPPLLCAAVRLASGWIDIEPEARSAVRSVRGARLNVCELAERPSRQTQLKILQTADGRLGKLGWDRVVCVMDEQEMVLAYLSNSEARGDMVEVCVVVLSDAHLVAVSASGRLDALSDLVSKAMEEL